MIPGRDELPTGGTPAGVGVGDVAGYVHRALAQRKFAERTQAQPCLRDRAILRTRSVSAILAVVHTEGIQPGQ